jgi:hypothetical protein
MMVAAGLYTDDIIHCYSNVILEIGKYLIKKHNIKNFGSNQNENGQLYSFNMRLISEDDIQLQEKEQKMRLDVYQNNPGIVIFV